MPPTFVELRPERRLLEHNFEGYKLNFQNLARWSENLRSPPDRVQPGDTQYSFLHAKLFALHNHLVTDSWDYNHTYYYIDNNQKVQRAEFNTDTRALNFSVVYDIPASVVRKPGHFNLCLLFPAQHLAVVSDGTGYLHIVSTDDRSNTKANWKTQYSDLILGEDKCFLLIDSRLMETGDKVSLHCLLLSVEQNEKQFNSVLSWVLLEYKNQLWTKISTKQLTGKGIVYYAAFETNLSAVYLASDHPFKFTHDTDYEIVPETEEQHQKPLYSWLQTNDDITITLKLQPKFDKNLLSIDISNSQMKISYSGTTYVNGVFRHKIDKDLTTWNVQENGQIDILVTKSESMLWDEMLEGGDSQGEQILDASLVEEAHRRLAHLCSETEVAPDTRPVLSTQQLEECDAASEEDTMLVRIDGVSHAVTHKVPLTVNTFLFPLALDPLESPALVLRHDVDGCVWQPYPLNSVQNLWPIRHLGTLHAFGYVQSSKQNRKFITCSPGFNYSVVCEPTRHIFIYKSGKGDCQLRKRTGGEAKQCRVGQQQVFNIDEFGEVLGVSATNEYLFLLTDSVLLVLEML